jgi:arginyl-tRNA--protein-N-Asp/Glu arginylyltransferase
MDLYQSQPQACPYLPDRESSNIFCQHPEVDSELYQRFSEAGFRRSGSIIYKPHCQNCQACEATRMLVSDFRPSKSQKRSLKKNHDLDVEWTSLNNDEEHMEIYSRYQQQQHQGSMDSDADGYMEMFGHPNIEVQHIDFRWNGKLIGVSVVDVLPDGLSSVYFYFDPDHKSRGLGTYSALIEIQETLRLGKNYWYLGFVVAECQKMAYKMKFKPQERLVEDRWVLIPDS